METSYSNLLLPHIQYFISQNLRVDLHQFLLKKSPFPEVSIQEIVQQIKGKQIAEKKLPFLLREGIIFPPHINLEQSSSQATAKYKANLLKGNTFVDITSGFGIDAYFISENFDATTLVEKNTELLNIVQHNWKVLDTKGKFINQDLHYFIENCKEKYDVLYLDPARRSLDKKKVFLLEDLSPNILEIQSRLLEISDKVLIKLSPLIDISYLISAIPNIVEIHIVALKNEVKEILVVIEKIESSDFPKIKCVNLESDEPIFEFLWNENYASAFYSQPLDFLYIPNNAILKSGAFGLLAQRFNLKKLHPNTHFYTSQEKIENFSGRVLKVKNIEPKNIKKGEKFNIISKNFPLKPEEIKKKYKIKDGGNQYVIFTQSVRGKEVLLSE